MTQKGPIPLVTGVSPKEGPPGTRITIRGENLGIDLKDLIGLKICGVDCLLTSEWKSPAKIIARTGPGKGKGEVLVITRSGGIGSSTVTFRGYFLQIGPLQESAVWIDETQTVPAILGRGTPTANITVKESDDPLGISDEGHKAKFTEEELLDIFQEASGDLSLENFSSAWYLLENHHTTNFDDLKAGLAFMKRNATLQSKGPIAFVKSNLSSTLECQNSLGNMYEKYTEDDIRQSCMNSYAVLLMQAKSCADGLFKEVLGRKDRADSTRNALSVLQRFRFLFYLPVNIEKNITKGDYNLVINDFVRAKSLFADTPVEIFKKVYLEVERRVRSFRDMIHTKLLQLPNTLDEQKSLIRYLINLEMPGDPAWECLVNQQEWLIKLLWDCKDDHLEQDKHGDDDGDLTSPPYTTKWGGTPSRQRSLMTPGMRMTPSKTSTTSLDHSAFFKNPAMSVSSLDQSVWKFKTPQKVLFIEELTEIMVEHFPDFWKLGLAYFAGGLILKETGEKGAKVDHSVKHSKFKEMISELISLFTNLSRAAFLPDSLENVEPRQREKYGVWGTTHSDIPGAWLPPCVRYTRHCAGLLTRLDLPQDSIMLVNELAFDMRTNCMLTLLRQAVEDVKTLHTRETWIVDTDDEFGGITQLPALFENIANETIQHLHEVVVQIKTGEPEIFSQRPVQIEATRLCTLLLQAFASSLENLAFMGKETVDEHGVVTAIQMVYPPGGYNDHDDEQIPASDKRLIMMLSNCNHIIERVLPRLVENLHRHGYVEMNKALNQASDTYRELDNSLFEAYVEEKSNPIVGVMEQSMYKGNFDWLKCPRPRGVRTYIKDTIMGMVDIHAEVFAISPMFITRVMSMVVEAVADETDRLIQCSPGFSSNGTLQAKLEISALEESVMLYKTPAAGASLEQAKDCLPDLSAADSKLFDDLLARFQSQMRLQLMCFQPDNKMKSSLSL